MRRKNPLIRAQNHRKYRDRQDNPHAKQSTKQFPRGRRVFELRMFPHEDFFPLQLTLKWLQSTCRMNYSIGEKSDLRGVERKEERKTILCRCKAFFIQNTEVNERTLPSVYGPLVDPLWQLLLIRVVRLGLAESCFLKARPYGGFSKPKWGFKQIQFNWHKSCLDAFTSDAWGEQVFLATRPYSSYFRPRWAEKLQSYGISKKRLLY